MMKIFKSEVRSSFVGSQVGVHPGTITTNSGKLYVSCGDGFVEIIELQLEGKKKLASSDFLRGARIESGIQLEERRK